MPAVAVLLKGMPYSNRMYSLLSNTDPVLSTGANDLNAQLVPVDAVLPENMRRWAAPLVDLAALYPGLQGLTSPSGGQGAAVANGSAASAAGPAEPNPPPAAPPAVAPPAPVPS